MTTEEPQRSVEYWMGKVDATMGEMLTQLRSLNLRVRQDSEKLDQWKQSVEERLAAGSARFEHHERRLSVLEDCPPKTTPLVPIFPPASNPDPDDEEDPHVRWSWVRDKLLVPIITSVSTILLGYIFAKLTGAIP